MLRTIKPSISLCALTLFLVALPPGPVGRACTTAVISGRATADGRPLLWKNRDTSSTLHNEVVLLESEGYRALAVVNAGERQAVWMGVNSAGFCIENSLSRDLADSTAEDAPSGAGAEGESAAAEEAATAQAAPRGPGNGSFMRLALQRCATVDDFRRLLEETNVTGRATTANFGVIDAHGGAAMFETSPTAFTMYDANDPATAPQGYIVRSNFAMTAQELPPTPESKQVGDIYAGERYLRACSLIDAVRAGSPNQAVDVRYVLRSLTRDLADASGNPFPGTVNGAVGGLPPIIDTQHTISRTTTVSAAVFHGVRAGEAPELTTMWTMLGDPKFSIAVPCWVGVQAVADPLTDPRGGEVGEIAVTLRDWHLTPDRSGVRAQGLPGIWEDIWPAEDQLLEETQLHRQRWLTQGVSSQELTEVHHSLAARAMAAMERELLEAKQLALAGADAIRIAIYDHSSEVSKGPQNLLRILTPEMGFASTRVTPEEIRGGCLANYEVLIMPGGSGSKQAEMLQLAGCDAIRNFVDSGGGYVGICAGSYLASAQYEWSLGLINARVWDRAHWARGTGTVTIGLTTAAGELFSQPDSAVDVYYGQGPLLVPGQQSSLPAYEVLATYETEVADKGAPVGAMCGTHAIIRGQYGSGNVICFSPHPEAAGGPNELILTGVRWAAGGDAR